MKNLLAVSLAVTVTALLFCFTICEAETFSLDTELGGEKSAYTPILLDLLHHLIVTPPTLTSEFQLECWTTAGNDLYIGVQQGVAIAAPIEKVDQLLGDVDHYHDLFPGYSDTHLVSRDGNRMLTFWEQKIPLFFVPNVKYEMFYLVDHSKSDQIVYRYQLKKAGTLKASDGFVLIQKMDATHTRYIEYDFFDAEWGAAKIMGKNKIWSDAVTGVYHSDLAIKMKTENPEFTNEKARDQAKSVLQHSLVDQCVKNRKPFSSVPSTIPMGEKK